MKKIAVLLVCLLLLSGCDGNAPVPTPTEPTAAPMEAAAPVPTAAPTISPEPTVTPEPTATPEPTPEPPAWVRQEESTDYLLLVGASPRAAALGSWLRGEGAELASVYTPEELGESIFTLLSPPRETGQISPAGEEEQLIRLAADRQLLQTGLLGELLPIFEKEYGYTVEVYSGEDSDAGKWASSGQIEVALLSRAAAGNVNRRGFSFISEYISCSWILQ